MQTKIHTGNSHLFADVLIIGAQRGVKFESSLSQLMCMFQVMVQLQTTQ